CPEVPLCIRGEPGDRIGVDRFENRSAVCEIPKTGERIVGTRAAKKIVVALLPADVQAVLHRVPADDVAERVSKVVSVLGEDARRSFAPRRAKTNAVKRVAFNVDTRNPKVDLWICVKLVESKPGEVESRLVQHRRLERSYPRQRDRRICAFRVEVSDRTALSRAVACQPVKASDVSAHRELIVDRRVEVYTEVVLISGNSRRQTKLSKLKVGYTVKAASDGLRHILPDRARGRSDVQTS